MIPEKTKARAIARITMGEDLEEISTDMMLPYKLVKDWSDNLSEKNLAKMQATSVAIQQVHTGVILSKSESRVNDLKDKIEQLAIDIVVEASKEVTTGDIIKVKALHLIADTCSKLYLTVINKGNAGQPNPGDKAASMFEQLSRD